MDGMARITASQLSEYLTASPARRKPIILDSADPKPYIVQTYNPASAAISGDLVNQSGTEDPISAAIHKLLKVASSTTSDHKQRQDARLCAEALASYRDIKSKLGLDSVTIVQADVGPGRMIVEGVQVNVRPEALLVAKDGANQPRVGALKFHFAKTKALGKKRADYLGAILYWYAEDQLSAQGVADPQCSRVIDLPSGAIHKAPKATVRNRDDIRLACEEIAVRWKSL